LLINIFKSILETPTILNILRKLNGNLLFIKLIVPNMPYVDQFPEAD